ncbi:MAG: SAM-dependent chlorinase/fluorinase [Myxococcota bacterium]|nr:SAM-dependent chlorinase/fluorinase [Myxococcota bacterium]
MFALSNLERLADGRKLLAVVDPGVGTTRRALAVRSGEVAAVGPDNGLLSPLLTADGATVRSIDPELVGAEALSSTFHGRDLFAPAAAMLAAGAPLEALGPVVADPVLIPADPQPDRTKDGWCGQVLAVDHFGNLITNLAPHHLGTATRVEIRGGRIIGVVGTYGDVAAGDLAALIGSNGKLELARHGGSAAQLTGMAVGDPIWVVPPEG